nr:MAG TPA: hypothetical protein [Bacteriophage sp.]
MNVCLCTKSHLFCLLKLSLKLSNIRHIRHY